MAPRLRCVDLEAVIAAKRQFLDSARAATSGSVWREHLRELIQSLEALTSHERSTLLILLLMIAEELRHAVHGADEYQARVEEALASPERPIQRVLECVQEVFAEMIDASRRRRPRSERVGSIVDAIERRYAEPLTLDTLARHVCRERGHVASQFRRETGVTIHRYLTRVRITHAAELLRSGEKVEAVMLMVGYHSKKSFYSQFRAHTGQTPGSYRTAV